MSWLGYRRKELIEAVKREIAKDDFKKRLEQGRGSNKSLFLHSIKTGRDTNSKHTNCPGHLVCPVPCPRPRYVCSPENCALESMREAAMLAKRGGHCAGLTWYWEPEPK